MSLLESVKEIGRDMSVYGLSGILSQMISLLLLPLYTQKLSVSDYGIFALIGICVNGYAVISNLGVSSAIFRFAGTSLSEVEKEEYLANAKAINLIANLISLLLFIVLANVISKLIFSSDEYAEYSCFIALSGTISSISGVTVSFLRVTRQTVKIAKSSLLNLLISVLFTFLGLLYLNWGIWGALLGGFLGDFAALVFLTSALPKIKLTLNSEKIKTLLKFALPILPHKIISFLIPVVSQLILLKYLDLRTLGIYSIALKFTLPLMLFTNLFQKSYAPYRFEIYKKGNVQTELFAKINLIYLSIIFLGYSVILFFGEWALVFFTNVNFHSAGYYISILALVPLSQSIYFAFGTGVEFSKSPKFYPFISGAGFFIMGGLSLLLVPKYTIVGAAVSGAVGWLVMAVSIYLYAQKIYPIPYLWKKIVAIALISVATMIVKFSFVKFSLLFAVCLFVLQTFIYVIILKRYLVNFKEILLKRR